MPRAPPTQQMRDPPPRPLTLSKDVSVSVAAAFADVSPPSLQLRLAFKSPSEHDPFHGLFETTTIFVLLCFQDSKLLFPVHA